MGRQEKRQAAKACVLQILQGSNLPVQRSYLVNQICGVDMEERIVEEAIDELDLVEGLVKIQHDQVSLTNAAAASERIAEIRDEVYGS